LLLRRSNFSVRDVQGTIEGGQIKLRSNTAERGSGDSIPYIFAGTGSGDAFSGTLYMGEYLVSITQSPIRFSHGS
jgi:D-glucosaminate-6-phosphate ammonia-lyase